MDEIKIIVTREAASLRQQAMRQRMSQAARHSQTQVNTAWHSLTQVNAASRRQSRQQLTRKQHDLGPREVY